MTNKTIKTWLFLFMLSGILSGIFLITMRFNPMRGQTMNYDAMRWILEGIIIVLVTAALVLIAFIHHSPDNVKAIIKKLDQIIHLQPSRLFRIQFFLLVLLVFVMELLLMSFISIPEPLRPVLAWIWVNLLFSWIILRISFHDLYKSRTTFGENLKSWWKSNSIVQKRVFINLLFLGSIYFLAYIPMNGSSVPGNYGNYFGHADEVVIYPSVVKVLTIGDTFTETLYNVLIDYNWWYGYPYLPISAAPLIIPRIIFGPSFGDQIQLNLLLLRQFINVLPMILAAGLLVYLVTRFKNFFLSTGMFIFLLLVPGILKFNYRFWHPDSIILLLIALTFFFLVRDSLKLSRNFYFAPITCGLAAVIKLWGFFFFLTIAGYLFASLISKISTFKRVTLAGMGFIAVMGGTILISSPSLLYPSATISLINDWGHQLNTNASGYNEPDPEGVYQTGMENWLRYFKIHFGMEPWFFFFTFGTIVLGSLMGSRLTLNRLLLGWCLVIGVYLVQFVAVKSPQYMIPLIIPLYAGGFLLPSIANGEGKPRWKAWLNRPIIKGFLWGIVVALYLVQFLINIKIDLALPFIM